MSNRLNHHLVFQVATHEIPKMRQKVSATQRDIDELMNSFYTYLKMKEKCSSVDTIMLVNDRLKRKVLFKSLRQDVQVILLPKIVCFHFD